MVEKKQRRYFRLTRAERSAIEHALDKKESVRSMARALGRSPSSIAEEIKRNRCVAKGPGKGGRVTEPPDIACPALLSWPWVCNGCKLRRYHCSRTWKCEYSPAKAQVFADELLKSARVGVNAKEMDFEYMMASIRSDVHQGKSPALIAQGRAQEFKVHPSTIYRWIQAGYGSMSNAELRRQVGYKPRREHIEPQPTSHGYPRSFAAFSSLDENIRAQTCEMDTVIGRTRDSQCILTLYLRVCKVQVALLLPDKTSSAAATALDTLEKTLGKFIFQRLFGLILTDNGCEFSDTEALERSAFAGVARCQVYYCDVRAPEQKAQCERNHVELRKLLPKGRNISFDDLEARDLAVAMSHLNSEPRPSLMGLTPLAMMRLALPKETEKLTCVLGIEDISYAELDLTVQAVNKARRKRGLDPLV